eukprot:6175516-Pleurochrysis_carterae.AAC.1
MEIIRREHARVPTAVHGNPSVNLFSRSILAARSPSRSDLVLPRRWSDIIVALSVINEWGYCVGKRSMRSAPIGNGASGIAHAKHAYVSTENFDAAHLVQAVRRPRQSALFVCSLHTGRLCSRSRRPTRGSLCATLLITYSTSTRSPPSPPSHTK